MLYEKTPAHLPVETALEALDDACGAHLQLHLFAVDGCVIVIVIVIISLINRLLCNIVVAKAGDTCIVVLLLLLHLQTRGLAYGSTEDCDIKLEGELVHWVKAWEAQQHKKEGGGLLRGGLKVAAHFCDEFSRLPRFLLSVFDIKRSLSRRVELCDQFI